MTAIAIEAPEIFVFCYTFSKDIALSFQIARTKENIDFFKNFFFIANKICELEAQTFLTDDAKTERQMCYYQLMEKIIELKTTTPHSDMLKNLYTNTSVDYLNFTIQEWRLTFGAMCTFLEWCSDINFFNMNPQNQKFVLAENPLNWY